MQRNYGKHFERARNRYREELAAIRLHRDRVFEITWEERKGAPGKRQHREILIAGHAHDACCLATGLAVFPGRGERGLREWSFASVEPDVVLGRIWVRELYGDELA